MLNTSLPRWKKDAKEFTVSVDHSPQGIRVYLPKPLDEFLGKPDKIRFVIEGKKIVVKA